MSDALAPKRSTTNRDRARRKTSTSKEHGARKVPKSAPPPRPIAAPRSTSLPPSRGKVLVIDDDAIVLQSISDSLSSSGFQVILRTEALGTSQWLREHDVDLVLLDVMMPSMGGADLAMSLKKRGLTRKLSVILHSSKSPSELGPLVRQTGALGAIAKTDDTRGFLAEFETLAGRHFQMMEAEDAPKSSEKPTK